MCIYIYEKLKVKAIANDKTTKQQLNQSKLWDSFINTSTHWIDQILETAAVAVVVVVALHDTLVLESHPDSRIYQMNPTSLEMVLQTIWTSAKRAVWKTL